ncbi:hypothetical protein niasHT_025459 [Heterodera trifolii]|uniref:Uncharacterized protein n=1 Tax=Heterodera trifolii TaxID=157864 RepID=A0ABD2JX05_9BILA
MSAKSVPTNHESRKMDRIRPSHPKPKPQQNNGVPMKKYSQSSHFSSTNGNRPKSTMELGHIRLPESERVTRKSYNTNCSRNSSSAFDGFLLLASLTDDDDEKMLRNPQAQGRSQSFRHRPVPRMAGAPAPASATARTTPAATADASQERRRSTPTITRRCSLQNRSRVEPRIDAWPEPKQRSEAEERFLALPDACDYTRVRQFNIDAKGAVIARGDSFRRKRQQQVVHAQRSNPIATAGTYGGAEDGTTVADPQQSPMANELAERAAYACAPATRSAASSVSSSGDSGVGGSGTVAKLTAPASNNASGTVGIGAPEIVGVGNDEITTRLYRSPAPPLPPVVLETASDGIGDNGAEAASTSSTFRICVLGQSGSGKSSLIRRFSSSDYRNVFSDELLDDSNCEAQQNYSVSVNIGGHECDLSFTECDDLQMEAHNRQRNTFHAYLLVYSIDRKASFRVALRALEELREAHCPAPIILVGNKMDLERRRTVMENEVKSVMLTFDVPHFQISVALNHDVDDLLVGIVAQIKEAFRMTITSNGCGENIRPASRASRDGGFDSDFHAAIRRFSRRKKRQMGLSEADDVDTGKCTNLFDKLRRWRRGTANL